MRIDELNRGTFSALFSEVRTIDIPSLPYFLLPSQEEQAIAYLKKSDLQGVFFIKESSYSNRYVVLVSQGLNDPKEYLLECSAITSEPMLILYGDESNETIYGDASSLKVQENFFGALRKIGAFFPIRWIQELEQEQLYYPSLTFDAFVHDCSLFVDIENMLPNRMQTKTFCFASHKGQLCLCTFHSGKAFCFLLSNEDLSFDFKFLFKKGASLDKASDGAHVYVDLCEVKTNALRKVMRCQAFSEFCKTHYLLVIERIKQLVYLVCEDEMQLITSKPTFAKLFLFLQLMQSLQDESIPNKEKIKKLYEFEVSTGVIIKSELIQLLCLQMNDQELDDSDPIQSLIKRAVYFLTYRISYKEMKQMVLHLKSLSLMQLTTATELKLIALVLNKLDVHLESDFDALIKKIIILKEGCLNIIYLDKTHQEDYKLLERLETLLKERVPHLIQKISSDAEKILQGLDDPNTFIELLMKVLFSNSPRENDSNMLVKQEVIIELKRFINECEALQYFISSQEEKIKIQNLIQMIQDIELK